MLWIDSRVWITCAGISRIIACLLLCAVALLLPCRKTDASAPAAPFIVWQDLKTGDIEYWIMSYTPSNGYSPVSYQHVDTVPDTTWHIEAVADLHHSGVPDLIWRNTVSGEVLDWIMGKDQYGNYVRQSIQEVEAATDTTRTIVAAVDVNGDGVPDLIWQKNTGPVTDWIMAYGSSGYSFPIPPGVQKVNGSSVGSSWQVVGAADVTGHGSPDLYWYDDDAQDKSYGGDIVIWYMSYSASSGYQHVSKPYYQECGNEPPGKGWRIVGVADLNNDGVPDLLWDNSDPTQGLDYWLMSYSLSAGYTVSSTHLIKVTPVSSDWHVVGLGIEPPQP